LQEVTKKAINATKSVKRIIFIEILEDEPRGIGVNEVYVKRDRYVARG
jgi:hypothetical protein